jgi:ligand-binding sensor domain-containing protein
LTNSNTSRDGGLERHWASRWLLAGLVAACSIHTASALDPNRAMVQYIHDRWGPEQGFPGGAVYAIAETSDGYLWIGSEQGLLRFDGSNFHLMKRTDSPAAPVGPVIGLTADAQGSLWIRTQSIGLLRYRDGIFQDVLADMGWADTRVTAMSRSRSGEVLFLVPQTGALTYSKGKLVTLASTVNLPHFLVISMAEAADGKVWMGTRDTGLFSLANGRISAVAPGSPDRKVNCLLPVDNRELWIGTDTGIVRWNGTELTETGASGGLHFQTLAMTRDHDRTSGLGLPMGSCASMPRVLRPCGTPASGWGRPSPRCLRIARGTFGWAARKAWSVSATARL